MNGFVAHVWAGLCLPRHLIATVLARCAVAGVAHVAGQHLAEPLASMFGFVSHVALLMAVFGLLAHLEAVAIGYALKVTDHAQPRFKAMANLARMRSQQILGLEARTSAARMPGVGETSTLTSQS